jgi:hypothetical protein
MGDINHRDDPSTFNQFITDNDSTKWLETMQLEMNLMHVSQVWTLMNPFKGIVPIRCKWVYKKKIGSISEVETYNTKLVVKVKRRELTMRKLSH